MGFVKVRSGAFVNLRHVKSIFIEKTKEMFLGSADFKDAWDIILFLDEDDFFVYSRHEDKEEAEFSINLLMNRI